MNYLFESTFFAFQAFLVINTIYILVTINCSSANTDITKVDNEIVNSFKIDSIYESCFQNQSISYSNSSKHSPRASNLRRPPSISWATTLFHIDETPNSVVVVGFGNAEEEKTILQIVCTAPYPIRAIFEETLDPLITNPNTGAARKAQGSSKRVQNGQKFLYNIAFEYNQPQIEYEKNIRIQCHSLENPCFGKTVFINYHAENESLHLRHENLNVINLEGSKDPSQTQIYSPINSLPASVAALALDRNPCKAYFLYKLEPPFEIDGFSPYSITCMFADGTPGKTELPIIYVYSVIRNSFRQINFQSRKCWKPSINENGISECRNCSKSVHKLLTPVIPLCIPLSSNSAEQNGNERIGSFAIFGIPDSRTKVAQIFLPGEELPKESVIAIDITSELEQVLNTTIKLNCAFSRYFLSPPFQAAVEYNNKEGNETYLDFLPKAEFAKTPWGGFYIEHSISIGSLRMKRIYCFAAHYSKPERANASIPMNVVAPLKPFIISNEEDNAGAGILEMDQTTTTIDINQNQEIETEASIEIYYKINEKNRSLSCKFAGRPAPKITWTRLNNTVKESKSGYYRNVDFVDYSYSWSEIHFPNVTQATGGEYICQGVNEFGTVKVEYVIFVEDTSNQMRIYIISASFCVIFLVCGIFLIVQLRTLRQQQKVIRSLTEEEIQEFFEGNQSLSHDQPHFSIFSKGFDSKYEIQQNLLVLDKSKILGSGNFGTVTQGYLNTNQQEQLLSSDTLGCDFYNSDADASNYLQMEVQGVCTNPKLTVAVKTVKSNVDMSHVKSLLSEVKIMAYLGKQSNIVELIGAVTTNIRSVAVEFCSNGDLRKFLQKHQSEFNNLLTTSNNEYCNTKDIPESGNTARIDVLILGDSNVEESGTQQSFSTLDLLRWSAEIANGLAYLSEKKVIHGDLAARNILLTDKNQAKISDFGLSRQLLNDYTLYSKKSDTPVPWKWLALESLKSQTFSVHSDMWSFGVVLWEIFSFGDSPYPGCNYNQHFIDRLENGERLSKPEFANDALYEIMASCWRKEPKNRPGAELIYEQIIKIVI